MQKQNTQRHRPDKTFKETMSRHRPCQSHSLMGYPETTGISSRKINLDFATHKIVNQRRYALEDVQELIELYRPIGGHAGKEAAERNKGWGQTETSIKGVGHV